MLLSGPEYPPPAGVTAQVSASRDLTEETALGWFDPNDLVISMVFASTSLVAMFIIL